MTINTRNGSPASMPPYPECRGCGGTVDLRHDNLLVEKLIADSADESGVNIWHKDCYDLFLDEGEEC